MVGDEFSAGAKITPKFDEAESLLLESEGEEDSCSCSTISLNDYFIAIITGIARRSPQTIDAIFRYYLSFRIQTQNDRCE